MPVFANLPERRRKAAEEKAKAAKAAKAETKTKTIKKDEVTHG